MWILLESISPSHFILLDYGLAWYKHFHKRQSTYLITLYHTEFNFSILKFHQHLETLFFNLISWLISGFYSFLPLPQIAKYMMLCYLGNAFKFYFLIKMQSQLNDYRFAASSLLSPNLISPFINLKIVSRTRSRQ